VRLVPLSSLVPVVEGFIIGDVRPDGTKSLHDPV